MAAYRTLRRSDMTELTLSKVPSVNVGLLIRTAPEQVFEALVEPAITTRFWYTRSSGPMSPGAQLRWDWEMYGVSSEESVHHVEPDRRIGFSWNSYDPTAPTTVDIRLDPRPGGATYVQVTETGFSGDGDTVVQQVAASTEGFTFVLCALKAWLE